MRGEGAMDVVLRHRLRLLDRHAELDGFALQRVGLAALGIGWTVDGDDLVFAREPFEDVRPECRLTDEYDAQRHEPRVVAPAAGAVQRSAGARRQLAASTPVRRAPRSALRHADSISSRDSERTIASASSRRGAP